MKDICTVREFYWYLANLEDDLKSPLIKDFTVKKNDFWDELRLNMLKVGE